MSITEPTNLAEDISPETCLRIHDAAMVDWLKTIRLRGEAAAVVTSWRSRAHADTPKTHGKPVKQAMPLPVVTLIQTTIRPDSSRWTKSPVRMTYIGPTSRDNMMYVSDASYSSQDLYVCNGVLTAFSGSAVDLHPIRRGEVTLSFTIGTEQYTEIDNRFGSFTNQSGFVSSSSIDYTTGQIGVTFRSAPDNNTSLNIRYLATANDDRSQVYHCPFPLPITIGYQIDIETKTRQDLRSILTQILAKFGSLHPDLTFFLADFPGYGPKQIFVELESSQDTSDLETGESERELRHTVTLAVQGWIFKAPVIVKTAGQINMATLDCPDFTDENYFSWYCNSEHFVFDSDGSTLLDMEESPVYAPPDRVLLTLSFDSSGLISTGP